MTSSLHSSHEELIHTPIPKRGGRLPLMIAVLVVLLLAWMIKALTTELLDPMKPMDGSTTTTSTTTTSTTTASTTTGQP